MRSTTRETVEEARRLRREMTEPEVILWQHLRTRPSGLKFRRQHPILRFVGDFYCASAKLIVEIDGLAHDFEDVAERDAERDRLITQRRVEVMRIEAAEIYRDAAAVVQGIVTKALSKAPPPRGSRRAVPLPIGFADREE